MAKDYWETPYDVVHNLSKKMGSQFTIDVACEAHNAKAPIAITDALNVNWLDLQLEHGGSIWSNPPYSDPSPWAEQYATYPVNGMMLVNASTSAKWFHLAIQHASELLVPDGRIGFYDPDIGTIQTRNDRSQVVFKFTQDRSQPCRIVSVPIAEIQSIRSAREYKKTYGNMHMLSPLQQAIAEGL